MIWFMLYCIDYTKFWSNGLGWSVLDEVETKEN